MVEIRENISFLILRGIKSVVTSSRCGDEEVLAKCTQHTFANTRGWQWKTKWWRHQMETFSALLAICAGNSPVPGEFPTQRPVTRSFDVYFDLRPNKRLSKQSWGWWFETLSPPLWRHRNVKVRIFKLYQIIILYQHRRVWNSAEYVKMYSALQNIPIYVQITKYCSSAASSVRLLPPTLGQDGHHFVDDIFRCIFLNEKFCIWVGISLKFVP